MRCIICIWALRTTLTWNSWYYFIITSRRKAQSTWSSWLYWRVSEFNGSRWGWLQLETQTSTLPDTQGIPWKPTTNATVTVLHPKLRITRRDYKWTMNLFVPSRRGHKQALIQVGWVHLHANDASSAFVLFAEIALVIWRTCYFKSDLCGGESPTCSYSSTIVDIQLKPPEQSWKKKSIVQN